MAALQCEICGGRLIGKPGGIFECDSCGTEYSTEWASAKIQEIKGTVKVEGTVQVAGTVTIEGGISTASLLKRGALALEDREWDNARKAFDRALDMAPENGHAYFGKLMAEYRVRSGEELSALSREFTSSANYQKARRFADEALSAKLEEILQIIEQREEAERREKERREAEARKEKERREQLAREKAAENQKKAQKQARTAAHAVKIALPIVAVIAALVVAIPLLTKKPKPEIPKVTEVQMEDSVVTEITVPVETVDPEYAAAEKFLSEGRIAEAAMAFYRAGDKERSFALWDQVAQRETVSAGAYHTVGLKTDGTLVVAGNNLDRNGKTMSEQCDVQDWADIVAVSAGGNHIVGLKKDGTVIATGLNEDGQCDVSEWSDIVAISAGLEYTVGLKADGTVMAVGVNEFGECNVEGWESIIAVSAGKYYTIGLKTDGTLVVAGDISIAQIDVGAWTDVITIDVNRLCAAGLRKDGTVFTTGMSEQATHNVSEWQDIVGVSCMENSIVGLKADGSLAVEGLWLEWDKKVAANWSEIVSISAGSWYTVALRSDGTVLATGDSYAGRLNVEDWTNIALPGELTMSK